MFRLPPREHEAVSWLYVLLCIPAIYLTVAFARAIQHFIAENYRRGMFYTIVITAVTVATAGMAVYAIHPYRHLPWNRLIWLFGIAGVWIYCTLQFKFSPEEALRFIEYGLLGLLLYRALVHRVRDSFIYVCALLLGVVIGIVDEIIQWITPERLWGLQDVGINALSLGLIKADIAVGLRPSVIRDKSGPVSIRLACQICLAWLLLLGLCLVNTPDLVHCYAGRVPDLGFLKNNDSEITEYGYCHVNPEIGAFFSRFTIKELLQEDRLRGADTAKIIDRYRTREQYIDFLKIYTPATDPFAHEARGHIFRRDRYLSRMWQHQDNERKFRHYGTVAYRENQILEKYFSHTFRNAHYRLSPRDYNFIKERLDEDHHYVSGVSGSLITRFTRTQVILLVTGLMILVAGLDRFFNRRLEQTAALKSHGFAATAQNCIGNDKEPVDPVNPV